MAPFGNLTICHGTWPFPLGQSSTNGPRSMLVAMSNYQRVYGIRRDLNPHPMQRMQYRVSFVICSGPSQSCNLTLPPPLAWSTSRKSLKNSLRNQRCCLFMCAPRMYTDIQLRSQAHAHVNTVRVLMTALTCWHQSVDLWISVCHEREGNIPTVLDPSVACLFKSSVWQYTQFDVISSLIWHKKFALSMR